MKTQQTIKFIEPRSTVEIHLSDGQVLEGPRGASIGDFLHILNASPPIVGAIVNGELRELTYPIDMDASVRPVTMGEADGMRIYRRSLTFLLSTAFEQLFPDDILTIDHSVSSGGYFCQVTSRPPFSESELQQIEDRMREIVAKDIPLSRLEVPINDAIEFFKAKGYDDKVRLLTHRHKDYLTLYQLEGNRDYLHGYMVPSTGYIKWFNLVLTGEGFTLRFPRRHRPTELLPLPDYPKLLTTFRQYRNWLWRLGIYSAGVLADSIKNGRSREVILVSEALHEQRIADIASQVVKRADQIKIILVAGPSSSGKTTFAKRLSVQLLAYGISPFPLEMDNYFLDRENTPLDENGEYDFESMAALDRAQLVGDLKSLIAGKPVQLPKFNFKAGKREVGETLQLEPGQIIILEGIHGLNPNLLPDIPLKQTLRVYVSALTQLNLDRHNRVSTTDTRLLRRIVRDARERGYSAKDTIQRWESVRRGEKRHIFPYQENSDVMFNSALVYELSVLKPLAEPLLRQVPYGSYEYVEAKRLLAFLEWFLPLENKWIPDNSILREFIGDSILRDFSLWNSQPHH
ncbi:nucleoside kinase [Candidatus Bathyarchaeota archaeon]|nr:nucleoside kinase [Candidatus Bathyarchaeota archaeon]